MMIFKKSSDPVAIKRISMRVWSLRDEIECALHRRIKQCEALQIPLYIEDIKEFYSLKKDLPLTANNIIKLETVSSEEESPPIEVSPTDSIAKADEIIKEQGDLNSSSVKTKEIPEPFKVPYERVAPDLEKISYGFSLLSDINMQSVLVFSKEKFIAGQTIAIEFLIPNHFMQSAQVVKCIHYGVKSRIISESKPDYRLQCTFSFSYPSERQILRDFLLSVEPDLTSPQKKNKSQEESSL